MTTAEQPPGDQSKAEDIPLEDIDKLLEAEDPEFTKQLEEVRSVENNQDINIEASVVGDDENLAADEKNENDSRLTKVRARIKMSVYTFKHNLKNRIKAFGRATLVFLKTKPKEYILYSLVVAKLLLKKAAIPVQAFKKASRPQQATALALIFISVLSLVVLLHNLRGVWLPLLNEPLLTSFTHRADFVETFDRKDGGESFYRAFPQERHEFLFRRIKVNLRATSENPNPMGAFELVVLVDSKDTAVEVRDREIEFFDYLQRVFEDETFSDLEHEIGKTRLKGRLMRALNEKLTQGWVREISFKTFILKP